MDKEERSDLINECPPAYSRLWIAYPTQFFMQDLMGAVSFRNSEASDLWRLAKFEWDCISCPSQVTIPMPFYWNFTDLQRSNASEFRNETATIKFCMKNWVG